MARLVGLVVVLVAAIAIGQWLVSGSREAGASSTPTRAIAVAERAEARERSETLEAEAEAAAEDEVPEELAFSTLAVNQIYFQLLTAAHWQSGAYAVSDSRDPEVAAADRDVAPRNVSDIVDDGRLNGEMFDGFSGVVQGDITPALYSTDFDASNCGYELWHVARESRTPELIGEEYLSEGRLLVTINGIEPDWFISDHGCGDWYRWEPRPDPGAAVADGDYWIGDLTPGRWLVPEGCLWEKTVAFRGALLRDVVDSGQGPEVIEITNEPIGLRLRSCRNPVVPVSFEEQSLS